LSKSLIMCPFLKSFRRIGLVENVARMEEMRNADNILVRKAEDKRNKKWF